MAAYMVAEIDVTDPAGYAEYRDVVPALIEAHGGRYLVRGGATEVLEGDWTPHRIVVLEFPSTAALKAFWASEAYRPVRAIRWACAQSRVLMVEGI